MVLSLSKKTLPRTVITTTVEKESLTLMTSIISISISIIQTSHGETDEAVTTLYSSLYNLDWQEIPGALLPYLNSSLASIPLA
jgi:hypothetical protein